jgi:hypothetical protein
MLVVGCLVATNAVAQICGDADDSGGVTVTDGVAVLRAAAELQSSCSGRACDIDGNGVLTVSDGVATLRTAAKLPASLSCGTRFGELVKSVGSGSTIATLRLGQPPSAASGAPSDVVAIEGDAQVRSGAIANVLVRLLRAVGTLLIGFRENGAFVDGFAELSLSESTVAGTDVAIELQLDVADLPGGTTADLSIGSTADGQVGTFVSRTITVLADTAPVISNLDVSVVILNDVSFCAGPPFSPESPGSQFVAHFAYSDTDGDVTDAAGVILSFLFSPSGSAGSVELAFRDIVGTPSAGTVDARFCYRFVSETAVDTTIALRDAAGNVSNAQTVTTSRPDGAN